MARARLLLAVAALALAAAMAACGSGSSPSGPSSGATGAGPLAATGRCGSFPLPAPKDPDGILNGLPARQRAAYAGYQSTVRRSAWARWTPSHKPPYTVAIVWNALGTNFQVDLTSELRRELQAAPDVGNVIFKTTGDVDVPHELQLMQSVLQQHPDLVILEPVVTSAFARLVDQAGRAGIPTLIVDDHVDSPYAVNVNANTYQSTGRSAAQLLRGIGGKGSVLLVHAIPGTGIDDESFAAFHAALKACPGVKVAGEAYGNFLASQAKSDTLRFLATHPAPIAGVMQTAIMAPGIMQAFQQTGRPMPIVDDVGPMKGSLGWWEQHRGSYRGVGTGIGATSLARTTVSVALRMLQGQGVKATDVVNTLPLLTDANLAAWAQPGWSLDTPGSPAGPPDSFADDTYLNPLFRHGASPRR